MSVFDAIVLAGGRSSRMGRDKAAIRWEGTTLLERVVEAAGSSRLTVVVGPRRPLAAQVVWTLEQPRGGGPVAGLAAGLHRVSAPVIVLLACDLPFIDGPTIEALVDRVGPADGCVSVDATGRIQFLAAAYKLESLEVALAGIPSTGTAMRDVVSGLDLRTFESGAVADLDTPADLARYGSASASGDLGRIRGAFEPAHRDRTEDGARG